MSLVNELRNLLKDAPVNYTGTVLSVSKGYALVTGNGSIQRVELPNGITIGDSVNILNSKVISSIQEPYSTYYI